MNSSSKAKNQLGPVFTAPCRIGDDLYMLDSHGIIQKETISGIMFWKDGTFQLRAGLYSVWSPHVGVDVFFTKEQAEETAARKKGTFDE